MARLVLPCALPKPSFMCTCNNLQAEMRCNHNGACMMTACKHIALVHYTLRTITSNCIGTPPHMHPALPHKHPLLAPIQPQSSPPPTNSTIYTSKRQLPARRIVTLTGLRHPEEDFSACKYTHSRFTSAQ